MKKYGFFIFSILFFFGGVFFFWKSQSPKPFEMSSMQPASEIAAAVERAPGSVGGVDELNNIIFSIKTKNDVGPKLKAIIAYAVAHPENDAAQFYAIMAQPIPLFKGIAWRMRMLVEPIDAGYISTITWLRTIKRNNDKRAQHLDALFDYFTEPNPEENIGGQTGLFTSLNQFQDYMATVVSPVVAKQIGQAQALAAKYKGSEPIFMFDAALIFGADVGPMMTSQTVRYRKFMPGHLQGLIANMQERIGFGYYLASYNMESLGRFMNSLMTQSFVAKKSDFARGLMSNVFDIHLQSPKEISSLLLKKEFANFLTLRKKAVDGNYLGLSLKYLRAAVDTRIKAYNEMEALANLPNQDELFVDADFITSRPAVTLAVLQKRQRILSGTAPTRFNDRVTNEQFDVNVAALFDTKNKAIYDLKKFYPRPGDFKNEPEKIGSDPRTFKWNYEYGTAQNWPDVTFGGVLPQTAGADQYRAKLISLSRDASTPALNYWLRLFM